VAVRGLSKRQPAPREARIIPSMADCGSTHRNISPACPRACSPRLGDRSAGSRPAPLWEDCMGNTFQRMPCHRSDVKNPREATTPTPNTCPLSAPCCGAEAEKERGEGKREMGHHKPCIILAFAADGGEGEGRKSATPIEKRQPRPQARPLPRRASWRGARRALRKKGWVWVGESTTPNTSCSTRILPQALVRRSPFLCDGAELVDAIPLNCSVETKKTLAPTGAPRSRISRIFEEIGIREPTNARNE
jgi:hypothetical protein